MNVLIPYFFHMERLTWSNTVRNKTVSVNSIFDWMEVVVSGRIEKICSLSCSGGWNGGGGSGWNCSSSCSGCRLF